MHVTFTEPRSVADDLPAIAFVGNSVSFSNDLLRLVSSDFSDFLVRRYASLGEFVQSGEANPGAVVMLLLDESYAERLAEDFEGIQEMVPEAHLVLAYRNQGLAVQFVRKLSRLPQFGKLCLLPMRMQYDTWRAVISLLISGEGYLPRDVVEAALRSAPEDEPERPGHRSGPAPEDSATNLTEREMQVLDLVSRGKQNKLVAAELGLSEHTVKLHMHHIITKLGARNRTEATVWYLSRRAGPGGADQRAETSRSHLIRPY